MDTASLELCKELYEVSGIRWEPVGGLEDRFLVSEQGQIYSLPSRTGRGLQRKQWYDKLGYAWVTYVDVLGKKPKKISVHRAVAEAFVDNPDNLPIVNHLDSNPSNNNHQNLEWTTVKGNVAHAIKSGNMDLTQNRGEAHGMHKLTETEVVYIKEHTAMTARQLREMFNVDDQTIRDIWSGRRWSSVRV